MEGAWFHDLALRRWIDGDDRAVLEAAFRILPSRLFANLKPAIVERWSGWSGRLGALATPVLAECQLEQVRPLLARHIERCLLDLEKTVIEKARDAMDGRGGQPFRSLQRLFTSGAPLQECDRILAEPEPWPPARDLLEKHRGASATTEPALAIATTIESLDAAEPADMAGFAVAAVLLAFERDEVGADSLSMDEALDALALDISDNRHAPQLALRLGAFPASRSRAGPERAHGDNEERVGQRASGRHGRPVEARRCCPGADRLSWP